MSHSDPQPAPGRPREFDLDEAAEAAMEVFWTLGYNGTSLPDLIDGTGLSRGSLYKAFGDKKGLFLAALDRYIQRAAERQAAILDSDMPARAAIHTSMLHYAQLSSGAVGQRGCLVVSTATEMASQDADIAARVRGMFDQRRNALARAIARGQAEGDIANTQDSQTLAHTLLCLMQGMRAVGKTGATKKEMTAIVDTAMRIFD